MRITPLFRPQARTDAPAQPYSEQTAVRYERRRDGPSVRAFEKSARGKQLIQQYRTGIETLQRFLRDNHPSPARAQQAAHALDTFHQRVREGADGFFSGHVTRLYGEGKASLDTLCVAITDEATPLSTRIDILENLAEGLQVCSEGSLANLVMAVQELSLNKGLHTHAQKTWEGMLDQALRDFSQARHGDSEHYEINEIHYVNGYRNLLAKKFQVAGRDDQFVDRPTVNAHAADALAFAEARVAPEALVRNLAEECLAELQEHFRPHLGCALTEETAYRLHAEYRDHLETGLQSRFGPIPAAVVISGHEPTGSEEAPYSVIADPALLMRTIAKNMKTQGLIEKEKFAVIDTSKTQDGMRRIKRIGTGDFYVKETTRAGDVGYRSVRVSDLPPAAEWSSELLMHALAATKDPEELRGLDPARVWPLIRSAASVSGTPWQAALMHPALQRYRASSPSIESALVGRAVEEVEKLAEEDRPAAVAQSLAAGDVATANWLASLPMPASWKDANGNTLLHHAAAAGANAVVSLLATPALLQSTNARGDTPLLQAARHGRTQTVSHLLGAGAAFGTRNRQGETVLYLAAQAGDVASVGILVQTLTQNRKDRGALDTASNTGRTPLMVAAANGQEAIVKMLRSAGANVAVASHDGTTALHEAARRGRVGIARLLMPARQGYLGSLRPRTDRANPDAHMIDRTTPLMDAVRHAQYEMAAFLAPISDLSRTDASERCPLMQAIARQDVRMAKVLIAAQADVLREQPDGTTPLMQSAKTGNTEMMALLLQSGAKVNALTKTENSALGIAAKRGHAEAVRLLLAAGAKPDAGNDREVTPLMYAAREGHTDVLRVLLAREDVEELDWSSEYDESALMLAAMSGHADAVQLLLDAGARTGLKRSLGIAREARDYAVLNVLERAQRADRAPRRAAP
ncbi:ankyrin repeat domain-containing protein [Paracidovorax konjaci]|uniref:Ankyrin repeat n=1 Tax=Paracidovorax konjaci TaxID=32040 RepID=A0A1I1REI6_9BURK|nr:ankyrin repeat domain-containing protein [Paracidovorax konjaci]SFD32652.1 Ankyrin repeat [Paracidovorax konjaci]